MYRLVMGCAIPDEGEPLHPKCNVLLPGSEIGITGRERAMSGGNPERGQISRLDEIAPESERQLCDDTTMNLRSSTSSGGAITRLLDVRRSLLSEGYDIEPGRTSTALMRPVPKLAIERVACKHLDHRGELHNARGGAHVPLVKSERVGDVTITRI